MENDVEIFLNDKFIVLKTLYEHQLSINNVMLCPITQQELADILGYSKAKVNTILNELMENEYVQMYNNTKGRYIILGKGNKALKKLL